MRIEHIPSPDRFWEKVRVTPGCWLWTSPPSTHGYGQFSVNRKPVAAHIVSFVLENGDVRNGRYVLHRCDNRLCVNPEHLFLGTHADNMADMQAKGRARNTPRSGEANAAAKLTNTQAAAVRAACASGLTQRAAAAKYGITQRAVWGIVHGVSYRSPAC